MTSDDIRDVKSALRDLDGHLSKMNAGISNLETRPLSKDRTGLYVLVIAGLVGLGNVNDNIKDVKKAMQQTPQLQTRNVIGNSEPETFYEINGQKVYLKIDGKNVEDIVGGK